MLSVATIEALKSYFTQQSFKHHKTLHTKWRFPFKRWVRPTAFVDVILKVQKCHENAVMWDMCFFRSNFHWSQRFSDRKLAGYEWSQRASGMNHEQIFTPSCVFDFLVKTWYKMDDLYSTQDFLRREQQKLLALLKDPDATWPSPSAQQQKLQRSRKASKKPSPSSPPAAFGTPEKDITQRVKKETIYHQSCKPEEPDRNFTATPVPRGILKGKWYMILHVVCSLMTT